MRLTVLLSLLLLHAAARAGDAGGAGDDAVPPCAAPAGSPAPRVWIFVGLPGDVEHEKLFRAYVDRLMTALTVRFTADAGACRVLFGTDGAGTQGACTRENLAGELAAIAEQSRNAQPIWIFFFGHANRTDVTAHFNVPGPDVTAPELGKMLLPARGRAPMAVFFTTSASGSFLAHLSAPGRVVVTATTGEAEINETDFPQALLAFLEDAPCDGDGVTILDIFRGVTARVQAQFRERGLLATEHALLDGDGDGKGTEEPAAADAAGAERFRLAVRPGSSPRARRAPSRGQDAGRSRAAVPERGRTPSKGVVRGRDM